MDLRGSQRFKSRSNMEEMLKGRLEGNRNNKFIMDKLLLHFNIKVELLA